MSKTQKIENSISNLPSEDKNYVTNNQTKTNTESVQDQTS